MRRTKIVATLGPASHLPEEIATLIKAGVDVVRLNKSHGDTAWHERVFANVRQASEAVGKPVAIMVDLQGPKMRIGRVAGGRAVLKRGSEVRIVAGEALCDETTLYVPLAEIVKDITPGDRVLLDDGNIILKVLSKTRRAARCRVVVGGAISDHKGVNLPGVDVSVPAVTEKDFEDLAWAARMGAEYAAISFVRRAEDITEVRSFLHRIASPVQVIAKIEKPEAVEQIDAIAELADGLMVARGDLGVEMNLEEVPVAQKRIIAAAHAADIPVIVATQMLESMTQKPRPTRAEVSDVASSVFGGTDAVMLSGETAAGHYPVESVRQMAAIAEAAERHLVETGNLKAVLSSNSVYAIADAVCHGANSAARDLSAKAVFISTTSGRTALLFSKYRWPGVLVGASDDEASVRRMALYWGVRPVQVNKCSDHQQLLGEMVDKSLARGLVAAGDMVVFVAGAPLGKTGATNLLMVRGVAPRGAVAGKGQVSAKVPAAEIVVDRKRCILCGACVGICPVLVFKIENDKLSFNRRNLKKCLSDWQCKSICPVNAIRIKTVKTTRGGK
ncbi:MAG: pyruvate kinase [Planctomycetes bacterium]|nr:pyruvate kinase [Planctomycetota bacterium]